MPKVNKISFLVLSFLLLCIMTVFTGKGNVKADFTQTEPADADAASWILREYNGFIALYEEGEEKPSEVFRTWVAYLPEEDGIALRNGIAVHNKGELLQLLQDYTG